MYYLYACRKAVPIKLVASFDSEGQLLSYVRWATVSEKDGIRQFEKGSALAGYHEFSYSEEPRTSDNTLQVVHNPTPSML